MKISESTHNITVEFTYSDITALLRANAALSIEFALEDVEITHHLPESFIRAFFVRKL